MVIINEFGISQPSPAQGLRFQPNKPQAKIRPYDLRFHLVA